MKIAVKDANIFIDLELMGLLDLCFQLGHDVITSSFVKDELKMGEHRDSLSFIRNGTVTEAVIEIEEMEEFEVLRVECEKRGLSTADASVLFLAKREQAILLTGDRGLREQADVHHVEFHGTIWILEELTRTKLLAAEIAADRLEALLARSGKERRYLPLKECRQRITKWRSW